CLCASSQLYLFENGLGKEFACLIEGQELPFLVVSIDFPSHISECHYFLSVALCHFQLRIDWSHRWIDKYETPIATGCLCANAKCVECLGKDLKGDINPARLLLEVRRSQRKQVLPRGTEKRDRVGIVAVGWCSHLLVVLLVMDGDHLGCQSTAMLSRPG